MTVLYDLFENDELVFTSENINYAIHEYLKTFYNYLKFMSTNNIKFNETVNTNMLIKTKQITGGKFNINLDSINLNFPDLNFINCQGDVISLDKYNKSLLEAIKKLLASPFCATGANCLKQNKIVDKTPSNNIKVNNNLLKQKNDECKQEDVEKQLQELEQKKIQEYEKLKSLNVLNKEHEKEKERKNVFLCDLKIYRQLNRSNVPIMFQPKYVVFEFMDTNNDLFSEEDYTDEELEDSFDLFNYVYYNIFRQIYDNEYYKPFMNYEFISEQEKTMYDNFIDSMIGKIKLFDELTDQEKEEKNIKILPGNKIDYDMFK